MCLRPKVHGIRVAESSTQWAFSGENSPPAIIRRCVDNDSSESHLHYLVGRKPSARDASIFRPQCQTKPGSGGMRLNPRINDLLDNLPVLDFVAIHTLYNRKCSLPSISLPYMQCAVSASLYCGSWSLYRRVSCMLSDRHRIIHILYRPFIVSLSYQYHDHILPYGLAVPPCCRPRSGPYCCTRRYFATT